MARTFLRQDTQIRNSDVYDDTLAAGATLESGAANIEADLNSLRSQVNKIIGETNWYDALNITNGKQRSVAGLNADLDDVEEHRFLFRTQVLTDVTVTAAQNWEVLSVAGSEAPTQTAAVGAVTTEGAVVAAHGGTFGTTHSLAEVAGPSAIRPKNLLVIRDASTGQAIQSGGKDVWGLLQSESATDGHTFDDATNQVQISFVIENGTGDDLIACPVVDIAGKTVNYVYVQRLKYDSLPESAFLSNHVFVDQAASVDVTRQNAYDNQGATAVELANNADLDLAASIEWAIRDAADADLFKVTEGSGGGTSEVSVHADVDLYDNDAADVDFASGVSANSGGTRPIDVGVTDGVIESTAGDLRVLGAAELFLDDGNQTGSTWAQTDGIKLSETTAEWDTFETNFGEVSLLNAINQAYASSNITKTCANVTSTTTADTDVGGVAGGANLDAQLHDLSGGSFVADHDVFLNGQLLRSGVDAAANNDVYPGTSLVNGQLKFEFTVKINDVICVISRA